MSRALFPLIRQFSSRLSPLLAKTPVSANQVSLIAMVFGLVAGWYLAIGGFDNALVGAGYLLVYYILDHCDGEIARIHGQSSEFGKQLDTFVDWVVHAVFFAALGYGYAGQTGEELWMWLGIVGGLGCTINYFIAVAMGAREKRQTQERGDAFDATGLEEIETAPVPDTAGQWVIFAFRELSRSDFCFIVLALAAFDVVWLLIPAGAIGSQVYWLLQFVRGVREYHA
ncbi:MAG: CDP-alcohol phosphatidyltransferase family protein [Rhodospirillaceae bacterium]|jgi:phosphatidylglycerophosphate synthase|nr:CDP-alcohol phosphatidyltransferase family protein [Rhodospirillaceae bacterium]MBT5013608.1 CDP-alcohol phosphatidyltransferase family protein [Rhodospirillaceae bacterium]MBT5309593.1 CDP-alcohol phosphatidyltransferase family protein [Rhodospirillaceae bacterium]MBT7354921.1 CDP-alcohol phosphatidyltransferase family protein [Rhodospirillaceae bacterium]